MKKKIFINIIIVIILLLNVTNVYADQVPQCVGSAGGTTTAEDVKNFFTSKSPKNWYNFYLEIDNEENKNAEGIHEITEEQSDIILTLNTYIGFGNYTWFYQYYLAGGTRMEGLEYEQISAIEGTIGNIDMWVKDQTTVLKFADNVDEEREEGFYDDSIKYKGYGEFTKTKVKEILEGMSPTEWLELTKEIKNRADAAENGEKVKVSQENYDLLLNAAKFIKISENKEEFRKYLGKTVFSLDIDNIIFIVLKENYIETKVEVGIATPGNKDDREPTIGDIIQGADKFLNQGAANKLDNQALQNMSNIIYNIFLTTGVVIAVIVGGILGIKAITEGLEGKAEVKEMLIPYIIGCVILFGGFTIWKIVLSILQTR